MLRLLNTRASTQLTSSLLKTGQIRSVHDLAINPKTGKVAVRHGAGGRSSTNELVATVFGCTGFIGRYVVNKIARRGTQVVTPYRGLPDNNRHLKLMGDLGQIVPLEVDIRNYDQVIECVRHSDVVVNLIGRYQETRNFTFDDTHNVGARTIARACAETGVHRLIHVSALNAFEDSPSGFLASKARGEKAVKEEFPEATIVRPGTMYGYEDYFLNRIGHTKHIHWMVNGGQQTLYPVNGLDVAHAIELLTRDDSTAGNTYELYGPKKYSYKEIVDMCSEIIKESINTINVPAQVLKTLSTALQVYPYRILRPDEVTRLTISDQPTKGALGFEDLGISPQYLENTILTYLRGYRTAQFYELGYDDEVAQKKAKF